jgi:hypothetical protein
MSSSGLGFRRNTPGRWPVAGNAGNHFRPPPAAAREGVATLKLASFDSGDRRRTKARELENKAQESKARTIPRRVTWYNGSTVWCHCPPSLRRGSSVTCHGFWRADSHFGLRLWPPALHMEPSCPHLGRLPDRLARLGAPQCSAAANLDPGHQPAAALCRKRTSDPGSCTRTTRAFPWLRLTSTAPLVLVPGPG